MNSKLFKLLLAFALFGIALGFFGILYEGVVYGPKMLGNSPARMVFWKDFYLVISPIIYYLPWNPLGMVTTIIAYIIARRRALIFRKRLLYAILLQELSFIITVYIVKGIDMKTAFTDISQYANLIPHKTMLFNFLSIVRIIASGTAMICLFQANLENAADNKL